MIRCASRAATHPTTKPGQQRSQALQRRRQLQWEGVVVCNGLANHDEVVLARHQRHLNRAGQIIGSAAGGTRIVAGTASTEYGAGRPGKPALTLRRCVCRWWSQGMPRADGGAKSATVSHQAAPPHTTLLTTQLCTHPTQLYGPPVALSDNMMAMVVSPSVRPQVVAVSTPGDADALTDSLGGEQAGQSVRHWQVLKCSLGRRAGKALQQQAQHWLWASRLQAHWVGKAARLT